MFTDYIFNGQPHGEVAEAFGAFSQNGQMRFDPGFLRPFIDDDGVRCVTINQRMVLNSNTKEYELVGDTIPISVLAQNGIFHPVFNATALRKEEWLQMDRAVLEPARLRLKAWADLAGANTYGGFNGMGKMVLEHETMNDPGEAIVDMDALGEGRSDAPLFQLEGLPLPITHSDFWISQRKLMISRNSGTPIDTSMGKAAGRRVAEMVEKTTIGVETGVTYGGTSTHVGGYGRTSKVYGYLNFTPRLTKTNLTAPTGSNPEVTVANVLAMRDQLTANKFYGPWMLYHSNDWDQYLDNDYARLGGNNASMTLRQRLRAIDGVVDVRRLDYMPSSASTYSAAPDRITVASVFTLLMVQMTDDVARAVNGMDMTVVQWESKGGFQLNFKVLCIWVPQLRADYYGRTGILQATTS